MTDLDWPADIVPFGVSFYLQPYTGGTESPFSRQTKVYGLAAPRWVCRLSLRAPENADTWEESAVADWGERIDAFLVQLQGRLNRVAIHDFRRPGSAVTWSNDAIAAGDTVVKLLGGSPRVGHYIGGDGRPHQIISIAVAGDNRLVTVEPPFRTNVAAGAATFEMVTGMFRLTSDDAGANPMEVGALTSYDLEFVEDLVPRQAPLTILGTIAIDNIGTMAAALDRPYPIAITIPWKAGLNLDFSDLRIVDEDGVTPVPFWVSPARLLQGTSAVVWVYLSRLDLRDWRFSYGGGSARPLSNGSAVFESFDDFRGAILGGDWTTTVNGGSISTQPQISCSFLWQDPNFSAGQALARTPTGFVLSRYATSGGFDYGQLYSYDLTGNRLAGPVPTIAHPYQISYVPGQNLILAVGDAANTDGSTTNPTGVVFVHDATSLAKVGEISLGPTGNAVNGFYMSGSKILVPNVAAGTFTEYTVNWSTFAATAGASATIALNGNINPATGQGYAYRAADNSVYFAASNTSGNQDIFRFSLATGVVTQSGLWRYLQMKPGLPWGYRGSGGTAGEIEGIAIDADDNIYYGALDTPRYNVFQAKFPTNQGGGAYLWTPATANSKAILARAKGLTGPARVLFDTDGFLVTGAGDTVGYYPTFGLTSADGTRRMMFNHATSTSPADTTVGFDLVSPGQTTRPASSNAVTIASLARSHSYSLHWDGAKVDFHQDGVLAASHTDTVVPLADAALLLPQVALASGPTAARSGGIAKIYAIATAALLPAGATPPTITVT